MRRNPDLVLVDTGIIANAPRRLFAAGLGDALSTWFEARACKNSGARTMARGNVSNTGLMMARLCYDLLMEKGRDALAAVERHEVTPALEDVVEATIYLSGLGFENGGLAAAHAVNDGFAQEPQAHGMYHGEKVAFGTLVQLVLEKAPQEELEQVLAFLRDTGLPLTLAQLGVKEIGPETLKKVAEEMCIRDRTGRGISRGKSPINCAAVDWAFFLKLDVYKRQGISGPLWGTTGQRWSCWNRSKPEHGCGKNSTNRTIPVILRAT